MRLLFELDTKDHDGCTRRYLRRAARAVIIKDGRVAMVHSAKYDYYKFPGGGIESGESEIEAVIRETLEETGLIVVPSSVREYGMVHQRQKSTYNVGECFEEQSLYYLCDVEDRHAEQKLDSYERYEGFTLEWVTPEEAIALDRRDHGQRARMMLERESRVIEKLVEEGYFDTKDAR